MDQFGKECKSKTEFSTILNFGKLHWKIYTDFRANYCVFDFSSIQNSASSNEILMVFRTTSLKLRQSFLRCLLKSKYSLWANLTF